MRSSYVVAAGLSAVLCGSVTIASAAADYFLKIEGIEGESTTSDEGQTLGISSFSWGTSNAGMSSSTAGAVAGRSAVRESPTRAGAKAPRDAASGMPTGKRSPPPVAAGDVASSTVAVSEPLPGADNLLTVVMPVPAGADAEASMAKMCATGTHIKEAVLKRGDVSYKIKDLVVVDCAVQGQQRSITYKTGHVTLMK